MSDRRSGSRVRAVARGSVLAFLVGVSTGCYTNAPLANPAPAGTVVVLDVNDRGRVALGESLGPSVAQIEGQLQSRSDSAYVVNVSSVEYLGGNRHKWSGEPVTIRADLVGRAAERRLSRSKTTATVVAIAGAVLAFIITRSIFSSGTPGLEPTDPGNNNGQ
jgi:hypothetical protein